MSAWTDGENTVVVGPKGLSAHRSDGVKLVLSTEQLGGALSAKKGKGALVPLRPLAVNPGAKYAFTTTAAGRLVRTTLGNTTKCLQFPWDISALAPATGQKVLAAYVTGTKARAMTSIVWGQPPADPKDKWEHSFEAGKPKKVKWPESLLWEKPQWSRKTRWTVKPERLVVTANAHGYTVYDLDSAVVGVLRRSDPKQPPEDFACVLRTPMDKQTSFSAVASARGVIVSTCQKDGRAVLSEFNDAGKMLAHRELGAKQIGPIMLAGERIFVLVEQRKLLVLGLDLSEQATVELPELPPSELNLQPNAAGTRFVLAIADKLFEGQLAGGAWSLSELDLSEVPDDSNFDNDAIAEAEIQTPDEPEGASGDRGRVRIITQAPRLSLDPEQPNDAWSFPAGGPFEIVLKAVSVGGPAETGLYVEVSGDALTKGLIEPESVAIEGVNTGAATFEAKGNERIARLPDFRLPAGVEPIKDKKVKPRERFLDNPEDTFVTVRLSAKALAKGDELLFVRVGFEGTEEGSLMRGRPLKVV